MWERGDWKGDQDFWENNTDCTGRSTNKLADLWESESSEERERETERNREGTNPKTEMRQQQEGTSSLTV